jgi:hypothetical protein
MGRAPSIKHSIERIQNNDGYSPDNCRWATQIEQANNKRNNIKIEYLGKTQSVSEWCRDLNLNDKMVYKRIADFGYSPVEAITTPKNAKRRKTNKV